MTRKFYVLDMFPYPSGEGLHVGHPRGYIATDVIARYKMMRGFSVLHPMGWDAFGLPAENYALSHKIHPQKAVNKNIKRFKNQLKKIGLIYDWDREINTTDPNYYKWTQWIFLEMFKAGLAYESFEPINWCPSCKTGLANEDLEDGKCERCGSEVERRPMRQWVLKMTAYAERLLDDLKLLDWPASIIEQQKNWIGQSHGAEIEFKILNLKFKINAFTTRLDTIFGCAYLVVSPEHPIIENLKFKIENYDEVSKYIEQSKKKSDLQRTALAKEKTGVELKGIKAINPFNNEEVPIFVADYVLGSYGAGAVMAVPAHDQRDWDFAKKYNLPAKIVICPNYPAPVCPILEKAYEEDGHLVNSGEFSGLKSAEAREKMTKWLEKNKLGRKAINYKMRDWVFSRQRYWGEPIPLIFCENCKKLAEIQNSKSKILNSFSKGELLNPGWIAVPEEKLPLKLPKVKYYEPTGTGESPLANIKEWVKTKCPKCRGPAKRETHTMPQWAGSSWYYLAYIAKKNFKFEILNFKLLKKWLPVDLYVGGVEHATRHLLYARFWHKFLYDIGVVSIKEPFKKLANQGLILGEDGRKMSKRWGNVIGPDKIIKIYGADSLRLYEMFMGPFNQEIAWNTDGIRGMKRFLNRIKTSFIRGRQNSKLQAENKKNKKLEILLHQTIKKVTEDIENLRFNTAISALMILLNEMEQAKSAPSPRGFGTFLKLLAPFAPHLSEKLYHQIQVQSYEAKPRKIGFRSIFQEKWPKYNPKLIKEERFELVIQINGKVRDKVSAATNVSSKEAENLALNREKIKNLIAGQKIEKIIFVSNKLINFVCKP